MEKQGDQGVTESRKNVMVALDDSEYSQYALEWVLHHLSDYVASSSLILFTAQPLSAFGYLYAASFASVPPELIRQVQEEGSKAASKLLEKAKNICANRGIILKTITEVGEPKEMICDAVEKFNIDLLVLGSHGKGLVKRTLLGSVSDYCIHHAKCTVLVVRKPT